jgi:hypothetical protein
MLSDYHITHFIASCNGYEKYLKLQCKKVPFLGSRLRTAMKNV